MIDLDSVRALIAAASDPTAAGLEAREELVPLAGRMADLIASLGEPVTEWAARCRTSDGHVWTDPRDDEQDALEFIASMPAEVQPHWWIASRVHHVGYWADVRDGAEVADVQA